MTHLPSQSAPVVRSRVSRGPVAPAASGVSPSITIGPITIGPFARDEAGVSPSLAVIGIPIGPFAAPDAK
jgi:hypothetical protein